MSVTLFCCTLIYLFTIVYLLIDRHINLFVDLKLRPFIYSFKFNNFLIFFFINLFVYHLFLYFDSSRNLPIQFKLSSISLIVIRYIVFSGSSRNLGLDEAERDSRERGENSAGPRRSIISSIR